MNVGGLEPINAPMAFGALLADSYAEDGTWLSKLANASFESVMQTLKDLPAMSQLSSIADAYKYSDEKKTEENPNGGPAKQFMDAAAQGFSDIATSGVPNILSGAAQTLDQGRYRTPQTSDKRGLDAVPENILNSFKMKIPGLRNTLPDALDSYGNPRQTTATPFQNALNSNLLPFAINSFQPNAVSEELFRLEDAGANVVFPARNPVKKVETNDGEKKLTADERRKYQQKTGSIEEKSMSDAIGKPEYQAMSDEGKAKVWSNIKSYASYEGRKSVGGAVKYDDNGNEKLSSTLAWSAKYNGSTAEKAIKAAWLTKAKDDAGIEGTPSQGELIAAITSAKMPANIENELIEKNVSEAGMKKYQGAMAKHISPQVYVQILAATTNEKMPANGVRGGHKAKVNAYLDSLVQQQVLTQEQANYLKSLGLG